MGVPLKSSISMGLSFVKPSVLGYPHFRKPPYWGNVTSTWSPTWSSTGWNIWGDDDDIGFLAWTHGWFDEVMGWSKTCVKDREGLNKSSNLQVFAKWSISMSQSSVLMAPLWGLEADEEPVPAPSGCLARKDRRWDFFYVGPQLWSREWRLRTSKDPGAKRFQVFVFCSIWCDYCLSWVSRLWVFFSCTELPEAKTGL